MNKDTIVFLLPSLKIGGGNRVFFELANILVLKYRIVMLLPNNSYEDNTFDINKNIIIEKIGSFSSNKSNKIFNVIRMYRYINKSFRQDKIIISDPILCLFLPFLKDKSNIYRFIQADDYRIFDDKMLLKTDILLRIYKFLCKLSYKQKINFIFNSKFIYKQFLQDSHRKNVKFNIVYPAINHNFFYDKNMDIRNKELNICLVGRKHPLKGLQTFIDMYASLDTGTRDKINNIFIISHDDLSSFKVNNFIVIKPNSDAEIADIYNKCVIFISTSWWEGFGLPGLEAMACGCALITSNSGGCQEYAVNNVNSLYFLPKSTIELSSVLLNLLENKELVNKLKEKGKTKAGEFSWQKSASQLENILYNELVASGLLYKSTLG
jgi:glycosyltransferase involved in cell wall biosynthesis